MLYREIIAVSSRIQTKHTNTLCGQNVEYFTLKLVVHWALKGLRFEVFAAAAVEIVVIWVVTA
jgi:hypothetical protein